MEKQERIALIEAKPDTTIFVVTKNGLYWVIRNCGYSEKISEARQFTKAEILDLLGNNGLMDKEIIPFEPTENR